MTALQASTEKRFNSQRHELVTFILDYSKRLDLHPGYVWDILYRQLEQRLKMDIRLYAQQNGIKTLDYLEKLDLMDKAMDLAHEVFF